MTGDACAVSACYNSPLPQEARNAHQSNPRAGLSAFALLVVRAAAIRAAASEKLRSAELLRLGFVMALAMTLHNMPEGFAVTPNSYPPNSSNFGLVLSAQPLVMDPC